MFCQHCGAPLDDGAAFCSTCGNQVKTDSQENTRQTDTNQSDQQNNTYQGYQQNNTYQGYQSNGQGQQANGFSDAFQSFNNTSDTTSMYHPGDISANKGMAILSYFGLLVLIPIFAAKNSPFARFHANQGLVLLIADILLGIVGAVAKVILAFLWIPGILLNLSVALIGVGLFVLFILGIVNAANGKAKELPLIGKIRILN